MSLLMNNSEYRYIEIAQAVFQEQFKRDPKLEIEMDERRKRLMYDNVVYNISFLMTSVSLRDEKVFTEYAKWIYELLCNLMKDLDRDRIMEQMVGHYQILSEIFQEKARGMVSEEDLELSARYLSSAIEATRASVTDITLSSTFSEGSHYEIRKAYLGHLLKGETRKAQDLIEETRKQGVPLVEIYESILARTMVEIGNLWHRNIITVDKEHYATSVTQTIMSSFYDEIFARPRKNKSLLSCTVGTELHEMGIRMLSDIFEYRGWDTYYMGAALPREAVIRSIEEHKPDLVALSVTMPIYLVDCREIVCSIRDRYPDIKIAVGGQAFDYTSDIWKVWGVDFYSEKATDLVMWAEEEFR